MVTDEGHCFVCTMEGEIEVWSYGFILQLGLCQESAFCRAGLRARHVANDTVGRSGTDFVVLRGAFIAVAKDVLILDLLLEILDCARRLRLRILLSLLFLVGCGCWAFENAVFDER